MKKKICLVTSAHIGSNPRIVKEADALTEAGYEVKVIYIETNKTVCELDKSILKKSNWEYKNLNIGSIYQRAYRKFIINFFKLFSKVKIPNLYFARQAQSSISNLLVKAAKNCPADLYIGHNMAALPAVYLASVANNSRFGFDAEDFHTGEDINGYDNKVKRYIEKKLLKKAAYITSASPMISDLYYKTYGVRPTTVLNVFPMKAIEEKDRLNQNNKVPSLYWFSQTIGPNRGLENILLVISKMKNECQIFLRGDTSINNAFVQDLIKMSEQLKISDRLHFLETEKPDDMVKLASQYDIGLSLELEKPLNRDICLTNKIFTYLLAGIPVLLSNTSAQAAIAADLGDAAILGDINNPVEVAKKLDEYLTSHQKMAIAKKKAKQLAETRYNWDVEKLKFLNIINSLFNHN